MIPTLVEQVIAARIPSKAEAKALDRAIDRRAAALEAVQSIGNATARAVSKMTGIKEQTARELMGRLETEGVLVSWKGEKNPNEARRWALANPPKRREQT